MTVPWIRIDVDIVDNDKIVALSSDSARWAALTAYVKAKTRKPQGQFRSRTSLDHLMGPYAVHVDELVAAGFLEIAPRICKRCRPVVGRVSAGTVVVHDLGRHQPSSTERVRVWREQNGGLNGHQTLSESGGNSFPDVSPDVSQPLPSRALSPSPSSLSETTNDLPSGGGLGEGDGETTALSWLASVGAPVSLGNGYHHRLIELAARQGWSRVLGALQSEHAVGKRSARQLVFGAEDRLEPIAPAPTQKAAAQAEAAGQFHKAAEATRRRNAELEKVGIGTVGKTLDELGLPPPGGSA